MTTLSTEFSEERTAMLKSVPILQPQDIAEAIGYVLSTPENVQVIFLLICFLYCI
jgi:NADP-dependent 3-hydroxy acid dehydrogenase YdfG